MRKTIQGMQLFNYLQIYLVVIKHVQFLYFNRYLVTRLKNLNYKRKKLSTCVREENCGTKVTLPSVQQPCLTDGDIEFFKNCVLPQQKSALEERLRNTVKGRNLMCASGANIRSSFPFYFVDSELVTNNIHIVVCSNKKWDNFRIVIIPTDHIVDPNWS